MKPIRLLPSLFCLQGCMAAIFDVDNTQAPQLSEFAAEVKDTLEHWYPFISRLLFSPTFEPVPKIVVFFDKYYPGLVFSRGPIITASAAYYTENQGDVGSLVHEMTHVIQQHRNRPPAWITEGIADWVRYWFFQPTMKPGFPAPGTSYNDSYGVAAFFLNWLNENKYRYTIYYLNKQSREGVYNDNLFPWLTGQTLEQNWNEMMRASVPKKP